MNESSANIQCVRFVPAAVRGVNDVKEIEVFADRILFETQGGVVTLYFLDFSQHQGTFLQRIAWRLRGQRVVRAVGERWANRFRLFTSPPIEFVVPPCDDRTYGQRDHVKSFLLILSGGYTLYDMT